MFGKKLFRKGERKKSSEYKIESEKLAVPEVQTHEVNPEETVEDERSREPITYENVAIPEIHIKKKRN